MPTLATRAISRLLFSAAWMGAALFVPARTVRFWQAWVYLGILAVSTALATAWLLKRDPALLASRLAAGPRAETRPRQKLVMRLGALLSLALLWIPGLDRRAHWSQVPAGIVVAADLGIVIGLGLAVATLRANPFASSAIGIAPAQCVITSGPYSIVRHPLYASGLLTTLFTPIALGSWVAMVLIVPFAAVIATRLLDEEQMLTERLAGYDDYQRQVRYRLVPGIW